jgi:3'-5' exoribonuclease
LADTDQSADTSSGVIQAAPGAKQFISDLAEGPGSKVGFFAVKAASLRATKKGTNYLALTLADKTGVVDAKKWDAEASELPAVATVVKVEFTVESYRDALQLKVSRIRPAADVEYDIGDFVPVSKWDLDCAWLKLCERVHILRPELSSYISLIFDDYEDRIRHSPAAKSNHQCYIGGLLEHITNLIDLADKICDVYLELDRDLLVAAAILHDIGKVDEISTNLAIDFTRQGRLHHHIPLGCMLLAKYNSRLFAGRLSPKTWDHLIHIVVSHHGQKGWSSPVVPATREALVFHLLDCMDARLGTFDILAENITPGTGFSQYSPQFEGPIWVPGKDVAG